MLAESGTFFAWPLCSRFGENRSTIILDFVAIGMLWIQGLSTSLYPIYFCRLVLGMVIGINTVIVPTYLVSISPPQLTIFIGSFHQLFILIGVLVAYRLGYQYIDQGFKI